MKRVILSVQDMKCDGCAKAVQSALDALEGVDKVEVSLAQKLAHVEAADDVSIADMVSAVRAAGYKAAPAM
jgi:copper chaperone CopZ